MLPKFQACKTAYLSLCRTFRRKREALLAQRHSVNNPLYYSIGSRVLLEKLTSFQTMKTNNLLRLCEVGN